MDVFTNLIMIIIAQYIHVSNHIYTLNFNSVICQLYLYKPGGELRKLGEKMDTRILSS